MKSSQGLLPNSGVTQDTFMNGPGRSKHNKSVLKGMWPCETFPEFFSIPQDLSFLYLTNYFMRLFLCGHVK